MNEFDDEEYNEYENEYPKHGSREKIRKYNDEETFEDLFTECRVDKIISNLFFGWQKWKINKRRKTKTNFKKIKRKRSL